MGAAGSTFVCRGLQLLRGFTLRVQLQPGDILSRLGGDEFGVLLADVNNDAQVVAKADLLLSSLQDSFAVDEHKLFINASIGIGCQRPASTVESLQREAYVALYHAKRAEKSRSMQFDPSMAVTPPERLEMEQRLRSVLANREMLLHYQPQVELSSGHLAGAEILILWQPPGLDIISPSAFVPILKETGMIVEFGHWALHQACRQGKDWITATGCSLRLAVNVSALQFARREFVREVEQVLSDTGFPPGLLELELTESMFVGNYAVARTVFQRLQRIGITLALDDFGTGQSSLAYLQELPLQRLKIDQSFVRYIGEGDACPPVVENISFEWVRACEW
jgi:predicted signal transduction protein with EAL and GGDEF domain